MTYDLIVIGAGAAGCYAAIRLGELHKGAKIYILEAARHPLSKVEISGGGRCNVTHACFDPEKLTEYYPRGGDVLLESFQQFHPADLIKWFKGVGVVLKTEGDGRMFPVTDSSATIIDCFLAQIKKHRIEHKNSTRVVKWIKNENIWDVVLMDGTVMKTKFLLVSSGSDQRIWKALSEAGHTIISPVPSLFTFNITNTELQQLTGISKSFVEISIPQYDLKSSGPFLITHWGVSGPAVLKLSAWGARHLYDCGYVFDLKVNWLGQHAIDDFMEGFKKSIAENPRKQIMSYSIKDFPARLWKFLCGRAGITEYMSGAEFGKRQIKNLSDVLTRDVYRVTGKSTYKDEFVTAGGVDLSEMNLMTFESKKQAGLFLAGEVLNIDALTGGFNFQAAWTGGYLVAREVSERI